MACLFKANKVTVKLTICKLRRLVKSQLFCKLGGWDRKGFGFQGKFTGWSRKPHCTALVKLILADGWVVGATTPYYGVTPLVWHHTTLWCGGTTPYYCEPPHYSGRLPHSCQRERQFAPIVSTSYPASLWPLFPSYFYSCTRFIHSQPFDLYLVCQTSLLHSSKLLYSNSVQLHIFVFSLYSHCTNVLCCECGE